MSSLAKRRIEAYTRRATSLSRLIDTTVSRGREVKPLDHFVSRCAQAISFGVLGKKSIFLTVDTYVPTLRDLRQTHHA